MAWRSDWKNAPKDESKFLVLYNERGGDDLVTTAYYHWYTEQEEGGFSKIAMWALHDAVRDQPLDDTGKPEDYNWKWMPFP